MHDDGRVCRTCARAVCYETARDRELSDGSHMLVDSGYVWYCIVNGDDMHKTLPCESCARWESDNATSGD